MKPLLGAIAIRTYVILYLLLIEGYFRNISEPLKFPLLGYKVAPTTKRHLRERMKHVHTKNGRTCSNLLDRKLGELCCDSIVTTK